MTTKSQWQSLDTDGAGNTCVGLITPQPLTPHSIPVTITIRPWSSLHLALWLPASHFAKHITQKAVEGTEVGLIPKQNKNAGL